MKLQLKKVLERLPTIPNDQTSDCLLYLCSPIDSGAIQRTGPMLLYVYSNIDSEFNNIFSNKSCYLKTKYTTTNTNKNKINILFLLLFLEEFVTFQNPEYHFQSESFHPINQSINQSINQ
jgi:hypothetical protein